MALSGREMRPCWPRKMAICISVDASVGYHAGLYKSPALSVLSLTVKDSKTSESENAFVIVSFVAALTETIPTNKNIV